MTSPIPCAPSTEGNRNSSIISPGRLQRHTSHKADKPIKAQLEDAGRWFVTSNPSFSRLTTLSYDVPAKLQDGPQCGIVAGWMAANALINKCQYPAADDEDQDYEEGKEEGRTDQPTLDQLQDAAIKANFSRKGEMFTAQDLADLITENYKDYKVSAQVLTNARATLTSFTNMLDIFTDPDYHQLLLVVYDSGPDQRPCNLKGHKAHWGVLTGMASLIPPFHVMSNVKAAHNHFITNCESGCYIIKGQMSHNFREHLADLKQVFAKADGGKFELIIRQSKSKRLFFFDPRELANSCCNLREISPGLEYHFTNKYVVPPGGIKEGLANKCILVKKPICPT